jgi:hypothetical protein
MKVHILPKDLRYNFFTNKKWRAYFPNIQHLIDFLITKKSFNFIFSNCYYYFIFLCQGNKLWSYVTFMILNKTDSQLTHYMDPLVNAEV